MFYSIYSNNCQHFILDLCEYIEVKVQDLVARDYRPNSSPHTNRSPVDEMQRDLGTQVASQSSDIQSLWIKSRLVFLLGNSLHFIFSITPPLVSILAAQLNSNPDIAFRLAVGFSVPFYAFHAWLVWSVLILSFETQPQTLDGASYLHGSCYTGSYIRRLVLAHPSRGLRLLIRFLLRVEEWPYESSLLAGTIAAVPLPLVLLFLSVFKNLPLLLQVALIWAPCLTLLFELSLLYLTLTANIKRLRLKRQENLQELYASTRNEQDEARYESPRH
jgi:hypothetical protein